MAPMFAQLKSHGDLHIQRKLFHFFSVFFIFLCMVRFSTQTNWIIYFCVGTPGVLFDIFRHKSAALNRVALKTMRPIMRKREIRELSGATYAVIAIGLIYFIFPSPIPQLATLFLAVGDPIASFFGLLFGKHILFGKKSLEGFAAAFVFCSFAAYLFFIFQLNLNESILTLSVICGFIAACAEIVPISNLDDNITQPILSSLAMAATFYFWGGFL